MVIRFTYRGTRIYNSLGYMSSLEVLEVRYMSSLENLIEKLLGIFLHFVDGT